MYTKKIRDHYWFKILDINVKIWPVTVKLRVVGRDCLGQLGEHVVSQATVRLESAISQASDCQVKNGWLG